MRSLVTPLPLMVIAIKIVTIICRILTTIIIVQSRHRKFRPLWCPLSMPHITIGTTHKIIPGPRTTTTRVASILTTSVPICQVIRAAKRHSHSSSSSHRHHRRHRAFHRCHRIFIPLTHLPSSSYPRSLASDRFRHRARPLRATPRPSAFSHRQLAKIAIDERSAAHRHAASTPSPFKSKTSAESSTRSRNR
jgi:hypothetical protein